MEPARATGFVRWVAGWLLALTVGAGSLRAEVRTDPNLPVDTAAIVNGQVIRRHLVDVFLKNDREALGLDPANEADRARLAGLPSAILEELVQRALIAQETQRQGIAPTPRQLDAEEKRLVEFCGSDARYEVYVEQNGFDRVSYRDHVLRPAANGKALANALTHDLDATDEEVRAYYEAHAADPDFQQPERVAGEHILVNARRGVLASRLEQSAGLRSDTPAMEAALTRETAAARARADEIRQQAAAPGTDFAALARQQSEDTGSREAGGSLGIFARGVHPAALDDVFFALKPGEVSPVVATEYGFHVLRITARYPAGPKTLAEAAPDIQRRLRQEKSARRLREWLHDARAAAQICVAVIDSGIDTTNLDLPFDVTTAATGVPSTGKVLQNVQVVGDDATGTVITVPLQANDDTVAHGTHCAGIVGGTGGASRTMTGTTYPSAGTTEDFSGVAGRFTGTAATDLTVAGNRLATASGVKLIGLGSGAGLFILDAMGGFEYVLANQVKYNIRVTSNSYGSQGVYNPDDALEIAVKSAYDHGITNVFAAGNSGPGSDTMSSNPKSPWVIAVAAGTKEGGLASFSSRGLPASQRTGDATAANGTHYNPNLFNLPAITAPGTGREFAFDAPYDPNAAVTTYVSGASAANPDTVGKKFYSDIISTLAKTGTAARGTNDQEFPTPYQGNYTMISGTSMACPFVAGACALLLSVNPNLTPAQIKSILQSTATHLPDYQDFEVGAGFLNAYAAVDLALNPTKPYAPFNRIDAPYASAYPAFITTINSGPVPTTAISRPTGYPPASVTFGSGKDEDFTLPYSTQSVAATDYNAAKIKAQTNNNAYAFLVDANADGTPNASLATTLKTTALDVRIQFAGDSTQVSGIAGGNTIGLLLWAPDGTQYSSGIALPVEDAPTREVVVKSPVPGLWVAEFRGLRGLAAVPVTPPTGVGLPDTVTGQIYRTNSTVTNPPTDINGIPQNANITTALLNRYFDQRSSGLFGPSSAVTRAEFAQALADNTPLRQSLAAATVPYTDASGATARYAEAAAQNGSTLRDWDFTPGPTLLTNNQQFLPSQLVSRIEVATAMVRAVGLDAEAQKLAGTVVRVTYNGSLIPVNDAYLLTPTQRGYLQLALNRGFISFNPQYSLSTASYSAAATPTSAINRADLATILVNFRGLFPRGNSLATTELTPQP